MNRSYLDATVFAADLVEPHISDGKLDFPDGTFADSVLHYSGHLKLKKKHGLNLLHPDCLQSETSFFEISLPMAYLLAGLAGRFGDFYDFCSEVCAHNVYASADLPEPLRLFAYAKLCGHKSRPPASGAPRKRDWLQKNFLWSVTRQIELKFKLKLTRNDVTKEKMSASDVVAEALSTCGRRTKYSEIKNLMVHPDYSQFRAEFEVAERIFFRWKTLNPPQNALSPEYHEFWHKQALRDVIDISEVISRKQ